MAQFNEAKMPNFFKVIDEMAKRYVELMQSDYRMKRKVGKNFTNAVATGELVKALRYRTLIKGDNISISVYAKGKPKDYFMARELGRGANKGGGGGKSVVIPAIEKWLVDKKIRLRDKKNGSFVKSTKELRAQVAYLIARKIWKQGYKGWNASDYANENIIDEYSKKIEEAYAKDVAFNLENAFNKI